MQHQLIEKVRKRQKLAKSKAIMMKGPGKFKEQGKVEAYAEVVAMLILDEEGVREARPSGWGHDDDRRPE